jgi:hypothetical protein
VRRGSLSEMTDPIVIDLPAIPRIAIA